MWGHDISVSGPAIAWAIGLNYRSICRLQSCGESSSCGAWFSGSRCCALWFFCLETETHNVLDSFSFAQSMECGKMSEKILLKNLAKNLAKNIKKMSEKSSDFVQKNRGNPGRNFWSVGCWFRVSIAIP